MTNTRSIVANTLSIVFVTSLFVLAFTWIIFDYTESSKSLKDAWDITGSFFGGITTLVAAYIATQLFNDWRDQHNKNIDAQLCMKVISSVYDCDLALLRINSFLVDYLKSTNKVFYEQEFNINLDKLRDVIDTMASSLSILGHIIPKNEYNQKILPNLERVISDLEEYYGVIDDTFRDLTNPMPNEFIQGYNALCKDSRMKYRAVIEELRRYYKA